MSVQKLITQHLDVWTSATTQAASGRGKNGKVELIGIQKLRELILDLAVRGKLVDQDPNDEKAAKLLDRIQCKKDSLIQEGVMKKSKKLTPIKEEEYPFKIPGSWHFVRLGDAVQIVRGITFPASEKAKSPAPGRIACLRTSNVQKDIETDDLIYIDESFVSKKSQYIQHNDIVMSMANSRDLVGKVAIVKEVPENPTTFGGFLGVFRPLFINPKFLMAFLRAPTMRTKLIGSASQTTNIANISMGKLNPLVIGVPPLSEQTRIAQKVDELMALCDRLEQQTGDQREAHETLVDTLLDTLTQSENATELADSWSRLTAHFDTLFTTEPSIDKLKQTILQLAVMGRLVEQNDEDEPAEELLNQLSADRQTWLQENASSDPECRTMLKKLSKLHSPALPYSLPNGWKAAHLIQVSRMLVDCHNKTAPYVENGIPIIRTSNIRERRFVFDELKYVDRETYEYWSRRCPPQPQDIIFTREAPMGEAAIIPEGATWCLGQRTMLIRPMHEYINNRYLLLTLTEPHLLERASEKAIGSTVKHLRVGDVEKLAVPVPPLAEQHRIVQKVDELMALCAHLEERLDQANKTRRQLAEAVAEQAIS